MPSDGRPYDPHTGCYSLACIVLTMAALHDLEVKAADVLNAYVMAPNSKKIWTVLGPEFGEDDSKSVITIRALYNLRA